MNRHAFTAGRQLPLLISLSLAALAGCDLGAVQVASGGGQTGSGAPDGGGGSPAPDASPDTVIDPGAADAGPVTTAACDLPVTQNLSSGKHHAGESCLGCHDGGGAPLFIVAGTLYTSTAGTTALPGATMHLVDAGGNDHLLVTALNGNFWSTDALSFPLTVRASSCPDTHAMSAQVQTAGGSCNQGGCHGSGNRISLP